MPDKKDPAMIENAGIMAEAVAFARERLEAFISSTAIEKITSKIASNLPVAEHFNGLSPAQAERLAILSEELGEVQQIIGKILRHGLDNYHPDDRTTSNRELLAKELGDVDAAVELLVKGGDLDDYAIGLFKIVKLEKLKSWTHHQ